MKNTMASIGRFFKKNVYYVLLVLCIAVIATVITLTLVNANREDDIGVVTPPPSTGDLPNPPDTGDTQIIFDAPVRIGEIGLDYSTTNFVWISTQGGYRTHLGVDFTADLGTDVYTAYEGVVESVTKDLRYGTMIKVKHSDELTTVYKGLDATPAVEAGDRVRKGDILGKIGDIATFEAGEGVHLHFEVLKGGKLSDPYVYLLNSEK